jgi:imidazolonepropionase-like amidohydrolase
VIDIFHQPSRVNRRKFLGGMAVLGAVGVGNPANLLASLTTNTQLKEKLPSRREFIIRGAYVMSMDSILGDIAGGDIHVRDGEITNVGKGVIARNVEEIDGQDMIALPGLIDTH